MRSKGLSFLKTLVKIGSGILLFLVILVFLFFFFFSGWEGLLMGTDQELKRELGVDISGYTEITESDNHGGFHGDGELLYTAYYNAGPAAELEEKLEVLAGKETSGWKKLPMTEVLQTAAYGIKEETRRVGPYVTLDGQQALPEVTEGYYYFRDRHSQAEDERDDSQLLQRHSFNFTLAVYDAENNVLYYYEGDT